MTEDQISKVVAGAAIATGVIGTVLPGMTARAMGVRNTGGEMTLLLRFMSVNNVALGYNLLTAEPERKRQLLTMATVTDSLCAVLAVGAGLRGRIAKRSAAQLAVSFGSVAAVAALPLVRPAQ